MQDFRYHIIKCSDGSYVMYCDNKLTIIPIDNRLAKMLKGEENGCNNTIKNLDFVVSMIESLSPIKARTNDISNLRNIDRITLCVSNDCNLRCKYCYAHGGSYGTDRGMMSLEVAERFVKFCDVNFDSIQKIVFFGGEPMLNAEVIDFVCKKIKETFLSKPASCPKFGLITNGTILDEPSYKLIERHMSCVTVSIDGPQAIHDMNRPYTDGRGSYKQTELFIKKIKTIPNLQVTYEATFTKDSIDAGHNIVSLKNFFYDTFGIKGFIVNDSHLDKSIETKYLKSITEEQIVNSNFECFPTSFWQILEYLVKRESNTFCNIGYRNFSVTTKGQLFACHLVNEKKGCGLGQIDGKNLFNDTVNYKELVRSTYKNNGICKSCWCKNLCGGCTVEFFYDKGLKRLTDTSNKENCNSFKEYVEQVIATVTRIREDKKLWELLVSTKKTCVSI